MKKTTCKPNLHLMAKKMLLGLSGLLMAVTIQAHEMSMPTASIEWRTGSYFIEINLDWLKYATEAINNSDDPDAQPVRIESMDKLALDEALGKAEEAFRENTKLLVDGEQQSPKDFIFPEHEIVQEQARDRFAQSLLAYVTKSNSHSHDAGAASDVRLMISIRGNDVNPFISGIGLKVPEEVGPLMVSFSVPQTQQQDPGKEILWQVGKGDSR